MSRRTSATATPVTVNLLSPASFDRIAARRLRRRFVAAGLVLAIAVGAGWMVQHSRVSATERDVATAQAETSRLTNETHALAPVRVFVDGVAAQQRVAHTAMSGEVYLSRVLDGLRAALPAAARFDTLGVTVVPVDPTGATDATTGGAVPVCPGPDPFNTRETIGCVTLAGAAPTRAAVGDLVIALGRSPLFVEPFISTTTTADGSTVSFSGSVGLSDEVRSNRYVDLAVDPVGGEGE